MLAVVKEKQITEDQMALLELERQAPQKFDHEFEFKLNNKVSDKKSEIGYRTYTREEVQELIRASNAPYETYVPSAPAQYPHMPRELAERLVREHFEYQNENVKKKEELEWDSLKMTELETKTSTTTKPSKSTKDSKRSATRTKKS
jgi:hypothetical protein